MKYKTENVRLQFHWPPIRRALPPTNINPSVKFWRRKIRFPSIQGVPGFVMDHYSQQKHILNLEYLKNTNRTVWNHDQITLFVLRIPRLNRDDLFCGQNMCWRRNFLWKFCQILTPAARFLWRKRTEHWKERTINSDIVFLLGVCSSFCANCGRSQTFKKHFSFPPFQFSFVHFSGFLL